MTPLLLDRFLARAGRGRRSVELDGDELHLADDSRIGFEESWRLCTQCHGVKLADWRAGVHGKRTGSWWGPKEYWSCVACHDPHSPRFESLEPMRPPARPEAIRLAAPSGQETTHEEP